MKRFWIKFLPTKNRTKKKQSQFGQKNKNYVFGVDRSAMLPFSLEKENHLDFEH